MRVNHVSQLRDGGVKVKGVVVDGGHQQVVGRRKCGASHLLLAGAKGHFVDPAHRGLAGLAKATLHAGQVLQLDNDVFQNVRRPGAIAQALQKTAGLADAAAVGLQAWQQGGQAFVQAGNGVGGLVFQCADVDPSLNDRAIGPDIGATQIGNAQKLNGVCRHESQQV